MFPIDIARTCPVYPPYFWDETMLCCGYVWLILLDLSTEAMVTTVTTMATTAATATRIMAAADMEASLPVLCAFTCAVQIFLRVFQNC